MIFSRKELVTKPCPDCFSGKEAVLYWKENHMAESAMEEFKKSPYYDPDQYYIVDRSDWSLVYHIHRIY